MNRLYCILSAVLTLSLSIQNMAFAYNGGKEISDSAKQGRRRNYHAEARELAVTNTNLPLPTIYSV